MRLRMLLGSMSLAAAVVLSGCGGGGSGTDNPGSSTGNNNGSVNNRGSGGNNTGNNDGSTDNSGNGGNDNTGNSQGGSSDTNQKVSLSGHITYDRVPPKSDYNGLDYANTEQRPAREVVVELLDASDNVLATTTTDEEGYYRFEDITANTQVKVRVLASLHRDGSPSWDVNVTDNTNGDALYVLDGSLASVGTSDSVRDLDASSGWDGSDYTGPRIAAPFAILDTIDSAIHKVLTADSTLHFPPLAVHWSINNRPEQGDIAQGQIGTSYYFNGNLYILGDKDDDTDEYDNHVIAHEWGHYYEDKFSRSDSIGGSHGEGDLLDIRVAFGEGWGNAFSAMALDDPHYFDTYGDKQSDGYLMDIESDVSHDNPGWFSETSIQRILYDLYDSHDDGQDHLSLGFGPIHDMMTDAEKNAHAFTSLFTFITALKSYDSTDADAIDAIVSSENIATINDIFGTGRSNHSDDYPYHDLTVGESTSIHTYTTYGTYNKLGNHQFVTFHVDTAGSYTVTVQQTNGSDSDPDFELVRVDSYNHVGTSDDSASGVESKSFHLDAGDYILDVSDYQNIDDAHFDVTVDAN
ncbi:SdrD B-like domain-containing protein [Nitratifractor sp.]